MNVKTLILIAHGSRRTESNEEFQKLVLSVAESVNDEFEVVKFAFLEIAKPTLIEAIGTLEKDRVYDIKIFPYFLNRGKHLASDLPKLIEEAKVKYPGNEYKLLDYFGKNKKIPALIKESVL